MTDQFNNQNGYGQPGQPIPPAQGYQQPGYQHSYTQPVVDAQNPRKTSSGRTFGTAFAGAALACVIAFGGFTVYQNVTGAPSGSSVTLGASTNTEIQAQSTDDTLPEAVAQKCLPSVAAIDVYTAQASTDMFGRSTSSSGALTESSLGSGVVLSEDGYIVTNNHVVAGADALKVTVGGEEYDADVVGTDESSDIAVIKLRNASGLTPVEIGDSDNLTIGEWVMSIGSPFGLEQSVATGIVSATSRSQIMSNSESSGSDGYGYGYGGSSSQSGGYTIYPNMIQTDAAINPGNSGGPTFNAAGQVIGINSSIASTASSSGTAGSIGIGFAIPSNLVKRVTNEIIDNGSVKHVVLGITIKSSSVEADGVTRGCAQVQAVTDGGPASKAGVKAGDSIVAFNGKAVNNNYSLLGYVRASAMGDKVKLTVVRGGNTMDLEVTLDQEETKTNSSNKQEQRQQNNGNDDNGNGQNGGSQNGQNGGNGNNGDGGGLFDPFGLW